LFKLLVVTFIMALSNELVFQWYNDGGATACADKIFDQFPEAQRSDTEKRSLRSRISYLVTNLKRLKNPSKSASDLLKQDFKVPESLLSGSSVSSPVSSSSNAVNNNDPKEISLNKDLRPRRVKQVEGNDEDSSDSWDNNGGTGRRRGAAGRINYNVKDMISNNTKANVVHDTDGRLVNHNGLDLCDCLESSCPGCHNPCPRCESTKCGTECRSKRKWLYEHILVEGSELKIKNPACAKGSVKTVA